MSRFTSALLLAIACLFLSFGGYTQVEPAARQETVMELSADSIQKPLEITMRDSIWFFHAGDLPGITKGPLDTNGWDTIHHTSFGKTNTPRGWHGYGWFGLWVKVDSALVGKKLAFRINHDGASEIFLDGKPIGGYGAVGRSAGEMLAIRSPYTLIPLWFHDTLPHLITIHYSNFFGVYPDFVGFWVTVSDYKWLSERMERRNRFFGYIFFCVGANCILGLFHFFLFLSYPKQRLNLYYALLVELMGTIGVVIYLYYQTPFPSVQFLADLLCAECRGLLIWLGGLLLYAVGYGRVPRWRMAILTAVALFYMTLYLVHFLHYPLFRGNDYFPIVFLLCMLDAYVIVFRAIHKRQQGTWLIGVGMLAVVFSYFFAWEDVFHFWDSRSSAVRVFVMNAGSLAFPVCFSLYLALDFARTNRKLAAKLQEVELLSAKALAQEIEKNELLAGEAQRLEDTVEERTAELKDANQTKARLFSVISHDLRAPISSLYAALRLPEIKKEPGAPPSPASDPIIHLLDTLEDLLVWSKSQMDRFELSPLSIDIHALYDDLIRFYKIAADLKKATIVNNAPKNIWVITDENILKTILRNFLSNAITYSGEGSIIVMEAFWSEGHIVLQVTNDAAEKDFAHFRQSLGSNSVVSGPHGLGNILVREFAGKIDAALLTEYQSGRMEVGLRLPSKI